MATVSIGQPWSARRMVLTAAALVTPALVGGGVGGYFIHSGSTVVNRPAVVQPAPQSAAVQLAQPPGNGGSAPAARPS